MTRNMWFQCQIERAIRFSTQQNSRINAVETDHHRKIYANAINSPNKSASWSMDAFTHFHYWWVTGLRKKTEGLVYNSFTARSAKSQHNFSRILRYRRSMKLLTSYSCTGCLLRLMFSSYSCTFDCFCTSLRSSTRQGKMSKILRCL